MQTRTEPQFAHPSANNLLNLRASGPRLREKNGVDGPPRGHSMAEDSRPQRDPYPAGDVRRQHLQRTNLRTFWTISSLASRIKATEDPVK